MLVRDSINSVRDAIIIGLILSVIILYAFLRNIGTTFVAILVIPVTILVTFLAMYLVGLSFDLMTLGGVAAAIGLVIDDAIVVVENIYTHLLHGESRHIAVQKAISEITVPIIGSTITPVVVFLPLTLLDRRDRRFLSLAGADDGGGAADFARAGVDIHARAGRKIRSASKAQKRGHEELGQSSELDHPALRMAAATLRLTNRLVGAGRVRA